jgi:creatinine amidohydrolase
VRIFDMNWMQVEEYLKRDDRIVLPIGSTEQHGFLSLGTDAILAERVSVEAAEPLGIPVLPVMPFGFAPYFSAYPGSMTLRISTYLEVIRDLLNSIAGHGFRRIAVVNGHGGNAPAAGLIREWVCQPRPERVQVLFHSWWNAPKTAATGDQFDTEQFHAGWVESFPWTRVEGAEVPTGSATVIPRDQANNMTSDEIRKLAPDGNMGGAYQRSDEDIQKVWEAGVAEVRELLESGWLR